MPISWSLDDHPHFEYSRTPTSSNPGLANAGSVLENWIADFGYMRDRLDWGMLVYTFHPYVIGRGHRMAMLNRLIKTLAARNAVFRTLHEVQQEYRDRTANAGARNS